MYALKKFIVLSLITYVLSAPAQTDVVAGAVLAEPAKNTASSTAAFCPKLVYVGCHDSSSCPKKTDSNKPPQESLTWNSSSRSFELIGQTLAIKLQFPFADKVGQPSYTIPSDGSKEIDDRDGCTYTYASNCQLDRGINALRLTVDKFQCADGKEGHKVYLIEVWEKSPSVSGATDMAIKSVDDEGQVNGQDLIKAGQTAAGVYSQIR